MQARISIAGQPGLVLVVNGKIYPRAYERYQQCPIKTEECLEDLGTSQ